MDTWAAYWHKGGLEIYRIGRKGTALYASGSLEALQPLRGAVGRKILIVGRDLLIHTRKKYPPASKEKLQKAVALEIDTLFPLSAPAFYCNVFESFASYAVVNIWAWETTAYSRLREIFPFSHVVPEDTAFLSETPEVKIFRHGDTAGIVALSGNRFIAGASWPASRFEERDIEIFLKGLDEYGEEIKKVTVYGPLLLPLKSIAGFNVSRPADGRHPPCLDTITALNLRSFKVKGYYRLPGTGDLALRVPIYLALGYGLLLLLTLQNYDHKMAEIRQQSAVAEKRIIAVDNATPIEDFSAVSREVKDLLFKHPSPRQALDMLAAKLPPGSFIKRLVLNENNLEITLSSREPLNVIKALGNVPEIKKVALKGAPAKDSATGLYSAILIAELAQ